MNCGTSFFVVFKDTGIIIALSSSYTMEIVGRNSKMTKITRVEFPNNFPKTVADMQILVTKYV
jgi:hypothetical protein